MYGMEVGAQAVEMGGDWGPLTGVVLALVLYIGISVFFNSKIKRKSTDYGDRFTLSSTTNNRYHRSSGGRIRLNSSEIHYGERE